MRFMPACLFPPGQWLRSTVSEGAWSGGRSDGVAQPASRAGEPLAWGAASLDHWRYVATAELIPC